ncbi:MAG: sugar-transfer associated ATP-grasp domain-containing protein [Agriterribacter sp.]
MNLRLPLYIIYYAFKTPWSLFFNYVQYVKEKKKLSAGFIYKEVLRTIVKHNASPLDYFSFRFFDLNESERETCSCTGFMYEYQLYMNPKRYRQVLNNKILFLKHFDQLVKRKWATLDRITKDDAFATSFLANANGKIVIKNSTGQAGKQVNVIDIAGKSTKDIVNLMRQKDFDLLEYYVTQHNDLMKMSSTGLNTIRVVTQYDEGEVEVICAFIRVSVNSDIDNLSTGNYSVNFGIPIDLQTGKTNGPGVYLNITKPFVYNHPITNISVLDFQIPFWKECMDLVTEAAKRVPENKSIGWDVAVANDGPLLIEGNHNWNNLSLVPGHKGYKKEFLQYWRKSKS